MLYKLISMVASFLLNYKKPRRNVLGNNAIIRKSVMVSQSKAVATSSAVQYNLQWKIFDIVIVVKDLKEEFLL